MIYGANGYSGELIARESKKRGFRPILAGRNAEQIKALAEQLKFKYRVFDLAQPAQIDLSGVDVVLNCAGPFSKTASAMIAACLKAKVHYLDITGEISVFAQAHALDQSARDAGIVLCPGVGFDVVPTDCVAALLKQALPDAQELVLAFDGQGGMSRGTAKTSVEGMKSGGMIRRDGKLTPVPMAWKSGEFFFDPQRKKSAMTIPWGDVYTAFVSTAIPNISVYMALPKASIAGAKRLRWFAPILGLAPVQAFLKWRISARAPGPDENKRAKTQSIVLGEVRNAAGKTVSARLITQNGYALTVDAALLIAQQVLDGTDKTGYHTPSSLCGTQLLERLQNAQLSLGEALKIR